MASDYETQDNFPMYDGRLIDSLFNMASASATDAGRNAAWASASAASRFRECSGWETPAPKRYVAVIVELPATSGALDISTRVGEAFRSADPWSRLPDSARVTRAIEITAEKARSTW